MIMFKPGNRQYNREKLSILREIIIHGYEVMKEQCPSKINEELKCTKCRFYPVCSDVSNLLHYINDELSKTYH